jgi:hypothetical protein
MEWICGYDQAPKRLCLHRGQWWYQAGALPPPLELCAPCHWKNDWQRSGRPQSTIYGNFIAKKRFIMQKSCEYFSKVRWFSPLVPRVLFNNGRLKQKICKNLRKGLRKLWVSECLILTAKRQNFALYLTRAVFFGTLEEMRWHRDNISARIAGTFKFYNLLTSSAISIHCKCWEREKRDSTIK